VTLDLTKKACRYKEGGNALFFKIKGCFLDIRDYQTQLMDFRERKLFSVFGNKVIQGLAKIRLVHEVFKEYHGFSPLSVATKKRGII